MFKYFYANSRRIRLIAYLSLLARFTRLTKVFMKCSDLSHKIFALNKGIRLTSLHLGKVRRIACKAF